MPQTISVTVRVDAHSLKKLEMIGNGIEPKPLNRSEMINVAIRDYVARSEGGKKPKAK